MRWTIRIGTALALLWAVYAISPYFAAYRLVTAVQARDVEALKERVNFHAVRISLAQQILAVYFSATGEGNVSEAAARQLASVAAEVAEPLIAQLLSPEVLVDLLDDGWPQSVVSERAPRSRMSRRRKAAQRRAHLHGRNPRTLAWAWARRN